LPAELNRELRRAEQHAAGALAPAMRRAYETDWRVFATWCTPAACRRSRASPASVAAFLASEADRGLRAVTVARRSISTPLERLIEPIDTSTRAGVRDRALLLVGFAAALRRSELVALDVEHLEFNPGARADDADRQLKDPDQERAGARVAVPYARARNRGAVRALRAWLEAAGIHRGPRCFGGCVAVTPSASSASQTSPSRWSSSADAQAEVSSAAQHEAAARRERLEADEAVETALTAAAQARAAEQAASERARDAEVRARDAQVRARDAQALAEDAERSDKLAHQADQRAASAEQRAQATGERVDRIEERAREDRATLERQLADERAARQAAELDRGQAQTALQGEQQLRAQLENDLAQTQRRLEAAEKARDAAIKSLEQAIVRSTSTGARTPRS
jgi:hypothetical protein